MGQGAGMQGAAGAGGSAQHLPMMGGPSGGGMQFGQLPGATLPPGGFSQPGPMMTGGGSSMAGLPPGAPMPGNPTPTQYNYGSQAGQPYNPNLQYPGAGMVANTATGAGSLNPMAVQQALQQRGLNPMTLRALGLG